MHLWQKLSPSILQRIIWIPTRFVFRFFFHWRVEGLANIERLQPGVIFALNHTSELDVFILPAALPFRSKLLPMYYLARGKGFYKTSGWRQRFYGGLFFNLWGAYAVADDMNDYEKALKTHVEILKSGGSICVFPEGKVTPDGKVHEGRGGVSYLSWKSGCPVVPVAVSGLWRVSTVEFLRRKRSARIIFGKPIYPNLLFYPFDNNPLIKGERNDYRTATKIIMTRIHDQLENKTK